MFSAMSTRAPMIKLQFTWRIRGDSYNYHHGLVSPPQLIAALSSTHYLGFIQLLFQIIARKNTRYEREVINMITTGNRRSTVEGSVSIKSSSDALRASSQAELHRALCLRLE